MKTGIDYLLVLFIDFNHWFFCVGKSMELNYLVVVCADDYILMANF